MDGKDLWTAYNVFVESGADGFLRAPERKPGITRDWGDSNGVDEDTTRVFLKDREIPLECAIIVETEVEFWLKYNGFLADLVQPGQRRWEVGVYKNQSFFVTYLKMDSMKIFTKWKNTGLIAGKFQLTLHEPAPRIGEGNIYLADEDGRLIIT